MTAYLKEDIPDWLHYRNNEFIQPILLVADEGWTIVQRGDKPNHRMVLFLNWCNACNLTGPVAFSYVVFSKKNSAKPVHKI